MVKIRVGSRIHSQTIRWITTLAILGFTIGSAQASVLNSCTYCHGMPPKDAVRKGNPHFDSNSSAMVGSHLKHLAAVPAATDCVVCHGTVVSTYDHQNDVINMAPSISGGSYGKGVFFNQTALPVLIVATCNNTTCHGSASPAWGNNTTNASCTKCHGVSGTTTAQYTADNKTAAPGYVSTAPAGTGRDTSGATAATDVEVGAHDTHLRSSNNYSTDVACNTCHKYINTTSTTFTGHMDGSGTVVFFGLATTNHAVPNYTGSSCSATYCHFGKPNNPAYAVGAAVAWNATTYLGGTTADCQKCHASPPAATGVHAGQAFPGSCNTCHAHISTLGAITNPSLHINGIVEATGHLWPYPGVTHDSAAGAAPYTACTTCHTNWNAAANTYPFTRSSATAVTCKTCHKGATFNTAGQGCADCHGTNANGGMPNGGGAVLTAFPNYSGSHTKHVVGQGMACNDCHYSGGTQTANHGSGGGILRNNVTFVHLSSPNGKFHATKTTTQVTCSSVACHGTAIWGVTKLNCVSCHSVAITRTLGAPGKTLAAASGEFGLAWGHKKTGRGAVTAADCVVCHLEGVGGTTSTSPTYHKNGTIDLRDPDGTGDARITNISNASFSFVRYSTSFAATTRTATGHLSNSIDNVITIKFCLKCHDANGATNTTARSGAGTAAMPFGGVALGANYTARNGAIGTQGLINVFKQFSSGNSSRHPVKAPNSRTYPYSTRLAAPYNNIGTTRNANTAAGNTASPRVKANSVVMYCADCHNTPAPLTLRTVTAHGNAIGFRGTYFVASPTLCTTCHPAPTTTTGYLTSAQHGAGSAFATGNSNIGTGTRTCHNCHFSSQTAPARPIKAADVHGFNGMLATGNAWTYGAANGMRPVAFIRNTAWSTTSPRPYTATVAGPGNSNLAAGQSNCGGNGSIGSCGSENHSNYSPGGSY